VEAPPDCPKEQVVTKMLYLGQAPEWLENQGKKRRRPNTLPISGN
jgi:hypothetical protein